MTPDKKVDPTAIPPEQIEPFLGQGGSFYFNPIGSRTLRRNRDDVVPYGALSKVEQARRVMSHKVVTPDAQGFMPAGGVSEKHRADLLAQINLTDADYVELNTPLKTVLSVDPVAASAVTGETSTDPAKKKVGK